ncbi:GNAT family N-acetyltransferase [Metabacillus herbersteinensis]|uniref:GNAT family N-acetyltransferase n=1 Tax=Metabacillus herbersteinensis TaxID=283816 RepID=A0ABV6GK60_9BACI
MNYHIKQATESDMEFLWEMLYQAIHVQEGQPRPSRDILKDPNISRELSNWGRAEDKAILAIDDQDKPLGAGWIRLFDETNQTYGYLDNETPVVGGLAILPEYRGKGIGTKLLKALMNEARVAGFKSISLSVDPTNSALHLYEKFGFKKEGINGTSWDMRAMLRGEF